MLHEYNVYTLISYNDINRKNTDDIFLHDLVIMNGATKAFTKIPILLEGKIQSDLGFYLESNPNKMQLTGFYSEKKSTSAAGVALLHVWFLKS